MIYGRIISMGINSSGKNEYNFELYNASSEMIDDYIKFRKEEKDRINKSLFTEENEKEIHNFYLLSKDIPLMFLAKNNFVPITEDFFFLK